MKRAHEWAGRRVAVLGAGRTGASAAAVLCRLGARVILYDREPPERFPDLPALCPAAVELALGSPEFPGIEGVDIVVCSPGLPMNAAPLQAARRCGIPILAEIEVAWQLCEAPIIAVTGTNGKSTTTAWIADMLSRSGFRAHAGGNLAPGEPLIAVAERAGPEDRVVAEVSSFQLEAVHHFRPWIAVLTNLTPDHLDRHGSMDGYGAAKARLFASQTAEDWAVVNADSPSQALAQAARSQVARFSRQHGVDVGACVAGGQLELRLAEKVPLCGMEELGLAGHHSLENGLAAAAAAGLAGASPEGIAASLRGFAGVAHRLETVATIRGVYWVNNSMCTNPDALIRSIESFTQPVVLIAGGRNKRLDFGPAALVMARRAHSILLIGEAAPELAAALEQAGRSDALICRSLDHAVDSAAAIARSGDVVVLSPGCASQDMFKDFMDRGNRFREAVARLGNQPGAGAPTPCPA